MAVDTQTARDRVIDAARSEFAEYGLAGARVDRIAASAPVSKERLYAYFGDKTGLFRAVLDLGFENFISEVPFVATELDDYAAKTYAFMAERPKDHRILLWAQLEEAGTYILEHRHAQEVLDDNVRAVERAQKDGVVSTEWDARDVIAMIFGIVSSWMSISGRSWADTPDRPEVRRRCLVIAEAVRALVMTP